MLPGEDYTLKYSMVNNWVESFMRLIYPAECGLCPWLLSLEERLLCSACGLSLKAESLPPSDYPISHTLEYLDQAWSIFPYRGGVQQAIHEVKFRGKSSLLGIFKPFFPEAVSILRKYRYDATIPIPISLKTKINRQFNPAELIAGELALSLGMPVRKNILWKKSGVESQSLLGKEERLANLYGAFKIRTFRQVSEMRILLVDDVFTTGSTADEAARILKKNGACQVDLFTLARTQISQD